MTVATVLRAARARIATPERWTRHCSARTAQGIVTPAWAEDAACWCADGALIAGTTDAAVLERARDVLQDAIHWPSIPLWNDYPFRTHPQILAGFDAAIALAESEEAQP